MHASKSLILMAHSSIALPSLRMGDFTSPHSRLSGLFSGFFGWRSKMDQANDPSVLKFVFVLLFVCLATQTFAQSISTPMPENAHVKSYGDGWECDTSFRLIGEQCVAVIVPENAYGTNRSYGKGWECHHGFKETNEALCVNVVVPEGGYLDSSGERWRCLRGFEKKDGTCRKIALPENAYLDDSAYGTAWRCDWGYMASDGECERIIVPENGYMISRAYGQPWTCERGYFENKGKCDAVVVPTNAYFDGSTRNSGWVCERGYWQVNDGCELIVLPNNAHLDNAGNRWSCNRNFRLKRGLCVLED